jgi:hypothetical protein
MTDVARGDQKFSWGGLASTMIEGGLDGALSAGTSRAFPRLPRLSGTRGGNGGADGPSGGGSGGGGPRTDAPATVGGGRPPGGGDRPSADGGRPPTGGGSPSRPTSSGGSGGGRSGADGPDRGNDRPSCQLHSFAPGTRVLYADGSAVPIEDVELGDDVVATDPQTGETAAREVTELHLNVDTDLTNLTVVDVDTGERTVLETTQNHPFWDATTGGWVEASALTPGHRLLVHDEDRLEGDGTGAGSDVPRPRGRRAGPRPQQQRMSSGLRQRSARRHGPHGWGPHRGSVVLGTRALVGSGRDAGRPVGWRHCLAGPESRGTFAVGASGAARDDAGAGSRRVVAGASVDLVSQQP